MFLGFVLFLGVSFSCRINLDNRVLQVFCIDLLKTKFIISLSEFRVDHRFLLLEMNIFLFQLKFSFAESTEAFTESTNRANVSLVGKKSNNSASRPSNQFSFEGDSILKPQLACSRLIVSISFI